MSEWLLEPFTSTFPPREPPDIQHTNMRAYPISQSRPKMIADADSHSSSVSGVKGPNIPESRLASCLARALSKGPPSVTRSNDCSEVNSDLKTDCSAKPDGRP